MFCTCSSCGSPSSVSYPLRSIYFRFAMAQRTSAPARTQAVCFGQHRKRTHGNASLISKQMRPAQHSAKACASSVKAALFLVNGGWVRWHRHYEKPSIRESYLSYDLDWRISTKTRVSKSSEPLCPCLLAEMEEASSRLCCLFLGEGLEANCRCSKSGSGRTSGCCGVRETD